MSHLHGVAWFNTKSKYIHDNQLENCFLPDNSFNLNDDENLPKLIDFWTSCSLSNKTEYENQQDNESEIGSEIDPWTLNALGKLDSIVEDVNTHGHRKTCRKKNTECRFNFPKLPSPETFIAKPLDKNDPKRDEKLAEAKNLKEKVKAILTKEFVADVSLDYDLKDLLAKIDVPIDVYIEALKISERGAEIVLKRKVKEVYINNYNKISMYAWRANMDFQICLDSYAVGFYVTDYFTKPDSGETKKLKEALKET